MQFIRLGACREDLAPHASDNHVLFVLFVLFGSLWPDLTRLISALDPAEWNVHNIINML